MAELPCTGRGADSPGRCQLPPLGAGEGKHPEVRAGAPSHAAATGSAVQHPALAVGWREARLGWRAQSRPLAPQPALPEASWLSARGDGGKTKGSKSLSCCGCDVSAGSLQAPQLACDRTRAGVRVSAPGSPPSPLRKHPCALPWQEQLPCSVGS